ncbi:hypothetical protein [Bergeyella sp. RCAD1439]|uniref:hypothetical protein n=1 Tax=Bergeyella anatis TaxID=3113737 RepID=UPI002E1800A3|nr:hypothetical protein [Bergeyella sp. RCAD1439]
MKKSLFSIFALIAVTACNQDNTITETQDPSQEISASATKRVCPSEEIRQKMLSEDPSARARLSEIETQTNKFIQSRALGKVLADGTIEIPVVVNVLYRTASENISDAQIQSQITVLNADYSATNTDLTKIPEEFQSVTAGNTGIRFSLAKINRKSTKVRSWQTNDAMKKATKGGIDATSPSQYLNLWVVGDMGGVVGNFIKSTLYEKN